MTHSDVLWKMLLKQSLKVALNTLTCFCFMAYLSFHRLPSFVHITIVISDQSYLFLRQTYFFVKITSLSYAFVKKATCSHITRVPVFMFLWIGDKVLVLEKNGKVCLDWVTWGDLYRLLNRKDYQKVVGPFNVYKSTKTIAWRKWANQDTTHVLCLCQPSID